MRPGGAVPRGLGVDRSNGWVIGLLLAGCDPAAPVIERIEPARGLLDRAVPISVHGRNLDPDAEEVGPDVVSRPWRGTIGDLPLRNVRPIGRDRIEADVPPGLAPGPHAIILESGSRRAVASGGFVAVSPVAPLLVAAEPERLPLRGGTVSLRGAGLHVEARVRIAGTPVESTWKDDLTLVVEAPPQTEPGPATLDIETPVGRAVRTDLLRYEGGP